MGNKPGTALINDMKSWGVDFYWHGVRIEADVEGEKISVSLNGPNKDIRAAHERIAELTGHQARSQGNGNKGAKANRKAHVTKRRNDLDSEIADLEAQLKKPTTHSVAQNLDFPRAIAAKFAAGVLTTNRARALTNRMTTVQKREFAREYDRLNGGFDSAS